VLLKDGETLNSTLNKMERLLDSALNKMERLLIMLLRNRETYIKVHSDL
jgi:hypothetical protein